MNTIAAGSGDVHVGGSDIAEEGIFKWINGVPLQEDMWQGRKPTESRGRNCLIMRPGYSSKLSDGECSAKRSGLLCQIDL